VSALVPVEALRRVRQLHASVDASVARLEALHRGRSQCREGCHDCCVDDLAVSRAEAARILEDHGAMLAVGAPAPAGGCAMLDERGACRVYASRPYVCRTQGLPLRWVDDEAGVEQRDVCPKNDPPPSAAAPALEDLPAEHCWTIGRVEEALVAIAAIGGAPVSPAAGEGHAASAERVPLRALFDVAKL
jgi:hypothetical protein